MINVCLKLTQTVGSEERWWSIFLDEGGSSERLVLLDGEHSPGWSSVLLG